MHLWIHSHIYPELSDILNLTTSINLKLFNRISKIVGILVSTVKITIEAGTVIISAWCWIDFSLYHVHIVRSDKAEDCLNIFFVGYPRVI